MTKQLVSIHKICENYQIPISFFEELQAFDLLSIYKQEKELMIDKKELPQIEKFMRLYFDLHINMEGIDVVINLLSKIEEMQDEINNLKNKLRLYEDI